MQAAEHHLPPEKLTDLELAGRIAAHDQQAFTVLMRRHNQRLFRSARSILHSDAEAEDAVQDAYLQAYRSIATFRGDAQLSTWLTRIVVNQALARLRKAGRRAQITSLHGDAEDIHDLDEADMKASTTESPESSAMRAQARAMLELSIDALPEQFRTVFVMRAVEEMSGEEVALCLDIPEATTFPRPPCAAATSARAACCARPCSTTSTAHSATSFHSTARAATASSPPSSQA
jgi:RNA polymerase sigma-70 factor, ECF subfamily